MFNERGYESKKQTKRVKGDRGRKTERRRESEETP